VQLLPKLWDGYKEEIDPVVDDCVVLLRDGIGKKADEEFVVSQVGRLSILRMLCEVLSVRDGGGRCSVVVVSGEVGDGENDGVKDVEELVLQVELVAVDGDEEAGSEGCFDRSETSEFGFSSRDEDLEEFGDDGVDVGVERSESSEKGSVGIGAKEAVGAKKVSRSRSKRGEDGTNRRSRITRPSRYVCVSNSAFNTLSLNLGSNVCFNQLPFAILMNPCPPNLARARRLSRTWWILDWSKGRV
jgi:hypothetical protein